MPEKNKFFCDVLVDGKPCKFVGSPTSQGLSAHKRQAHPTSPSQKQIKTNEQALAEITDISKKEALSPSEKLRVDNLKSQLQNRTEESKSSDLKEKEIQELLKSKREKQAIIDNLRLDQQLKNFQEQTPNSLSIKDIKEIKFAEALSGSNKQDNFMPQFYQMQMQRDDKAHERELLIIKELAQIKAEKKDIKTTMADFNEFQNVVEKSLKQGGWIKSQGDESVWSQFANVINENVPRVMQALEQRKQNQEPKITNIYRPESQPQIHENNSIASPEAVQAASPTPSLAPQQIPQQLTDQQVLDYSKTHDLSEFGDFSTDYNALNESVNQYVYSNPLTTTSPMH